MRVLQALWDGGGNVAPQLGITRELLRRRHEVVVLGNRCQRERVEATGATFVAYRHAPDNDASRPETDLLRDWEARTPIGAFARVRDRLMYGPCALFARDVVEQLERCPAEVVAWDYLLIGAGIGAEAAGARSAAIVHTPYPLPAPGVPPFGQGFAPARGLVGRARDAIFTRALLLAFQPGVKPANAARAALGLPALRTPFDQVAGAGRVLVLTSPALDLAGRAELPGNVRFTGPVIEPAREGEPLEPPLVLASFSTTYMSQDDLAARVVEALGELPVRGVLTAGPALDPSRLPQRANVEVRGFVPHGEILPRASLVVTHAGLGTVHAALAHGVPLVCLPSGRDQPDVAARVVAARAGVRLRQGASARRLRAAIAAALADPMLRDGARLLARDFAARDGAASAADELERLAAG